MELQHLDVKLPLAAPPASQPELEAFIPVFQRWIREQVCEELLIDVADYRHVHEGPEVILIGHQADYGMDATGGVLGLRYRRKTMLPDDNRERLCRALRALLGAARRLEQSPGLRGVLHFERRELQIAVNDRLLAPNHPRTFAALRAELEPLLKEVFGPGGDFSLHPDPDSRGLATFTLRAALPLELEALPRLSGDRPPDRERMM